MTDTDTQLAALNARAALGAGCLPPIGAKLRGAGSNSKYHVIAHVLPPNDIPHMVVRTWLRRRRRWHYVVEPFFAIDLGQYTLEGAKP